MPAPPSPYAPPSAESYRAAGSEPAATTPIPQASWMVAAFLSLLVAGLGSAYARRPLRALAWALGSDACLLALRVPSLTAVIVGVSAFLAVWVAQIADAARVVRRRLGPRETIGRILVSAVVLLTIAILGRVGIRRYVVEAFKIPSGSMIPALLVGDHVMVDKRREAARGDIVVFPSPEHPEQDFVKRIVGLPGDRVEFRKGHPSVNGVEVPSCYVGVTSYVEADSPSPRHDVDLYLERLGARSYLAFYDHADGVNEHDGPYVVASGEVFVAGDNRNNAYDSRMWWGGKGGGVPIATIAGVPYLVWLSVGENGIDYTRLGIDLDQPTLPEAMRTLTPQFESCLAKLR